MIAPITKLLRAVSEKGWKGTITQLYLIGDLKFGVLKGTDKFNNKYYEDLDLPFGQHRWVEYSNIHNPDATMIQPEWHGWMHHMYDETPDEYATNSIPYININENGTDAIFNSYVGKIADRVVAQEQVDTSQYSSFTNSSTQILKNDTAVTNVYNRQRGYKVGSLMRGPDDPDIYYKQPGHALSPDADKGGRYNDLKGVETPDPNDILNK